MVILEALESSMDKIMGNAMDSWTLERFVGHQGLWFGGLGLKVCDFWG